MFVGISVVPPFGVFIGAFAGAVIGELIAKGRAVDSVEPGWGMFHGIVLAIGISSHSPAASRSSIYEQSSPER